jgi:hypothetical protein
MWRSILAFIVCPQLVYLYQSPQVADADLLLTHAFAMTLRTCHLRRLTTSSAIVALSANRNRDFYAHLLLLSRSRIRSVISEFMRSTDRKSVG